jgi:hypothetical protein
MYSAGLNVPLAYKDGTEFLKVKQENHEVFSFVDELPSFIPAVQCSDGWLLGWHSKIRY